MKQVDSLIIGAGISGLTIASELTARGEKVICIEKARGTGGRLSSKRVSAPSLDPAGFDLGCAAFASVTETFRKQTELWQQQGVVTHWTACEGKDWFIAVPRSSAITRRLSEQCEVMFSTRAGRIVRDGDGWLVYRCSDPKDPESEQLPFIKAGRVILTIPPAQALDILPPHHDAARQLDTISLLPQWVLLLESSEPLQGIQPLQFFDDDVITLISEENSKPGRAECRATQLHIQATTGWSLNNTELSPADVTGILTERAADLLKQDFSVVRQHAHRWLYSVCGNSGSDDGFYLSDDGIGLASDYMRADDTVSGVEAAWLSAQALLRHPLLSAEREPAMKEETI